VVVAFAAVQIRPRRDDDLDDLVGIAAAVQADSGYPHRSVTDLAAFVARPGAALAAWVAEDGGEVVGHVALHPTGSKEMSTVVRAAIGDGVPFGVVSRLFVSPAVRRRGTGRVLLETCTADALARDLVPVLDVSIHFGPANALYRACGYEPIGTASVPLRDGIVFEENVYRFVGG